MLLERKHMAPRSSTTRRTDINHRKRACFSGPFCKLACSARKALLTFIERGRTAILATMAEVDSMISVTGGALGDSGCAQVETVTARILSHFRIRALVFLVTALTLAASQLV